MNFQQPLGDVNAEISIDADQVGVESGVVELRERQAIRDDWLPKLLMLIDDNVGRVEKSWLWQLRDGTATIVGGENGVSE